MVAGGKQCATRSTITPSKTCCATVYRCIKRRLNDHTARGIWSLPESKLPETEGGLRGPKRVPKPLPKQLCPDGNRQYHSGCLRKLRWGVKSGPMCALLWRILTWCTSKQVTFRARHIPGQLNIVADKMFKLGQTIQTEWSLPRKSSRQYATGGTDPK